MSPTKKIPRIQGKPISLPRESADWVFQEHEQAVGRIQRPESSRSPPFPKTRFKPRSRRLARRGRQKGAAHFLMLIIIGKFHSEKEPVLPTSFGEWPSELLMGFWVPRVPMVNICNAASSFTSSFCFKESKMKKKEEKAKGIHYSSFSFNIGRM